MRIGCLQFSPQKGEVDHNLNRADEVLRKAGERRLDDLDILVVPELAITGSNYRSLQEIDPFLEPGTSSTTSLWARIKALKHDCYVCVGYPERRDVSANWPTGPEYYNSVVLVNGNGENACNYRKCGLDPVEEAWALEGQGFHDQWVEGLGNVTIGISTDLDKHKFDEFGNKIYTFAEHAVLSESNLVVVNMAWTTQKDPRAYSQHAAEPDWDSLEHWILRMQPIYEKTRRTGDEVTVVFCNRIGAEEGHYPGEDVMYSGSSTIISFRAGEILLYGSLGRGEKSVLFVNTDQQHYDKLEIEWPVQYPVEKRLEGAENIAATSCGLSHPERQDVLTYIDIPHAEISVAKMKSPKDNVSAFVHCAGAPAASPPVPPPVPARAFGDFVQEHNRKKLEAAKRSPKGLSIRTSRQANDDSGVIPTPSAPTPVPFSMRPKLIIPGSTQSPPTSAVDEFFEPLSAASFHSQSSAYSNQSGLSNLSTMSQVSQSTVKSFMRPPEDSTPYPRSSARGSTPWNDVYSGSVSFDAPDYDEQPDMFYRIKEGIYQSPFQEERKTPEPFRWPASRGPAVAPWQETIPDSYAEDDDVPEPLTAFSDGDEDIEQGFVNPILAFAQQTAHLAPDADVIERIRNMAPSDSPVPNRPSSPKSRNASRTRMATSSQIRRHGTPSVDIQRPESKKADIIDVQVFASPSLVKDSSSDRGRPSLQASPAEAAEAPRRGGSLPPNMKPVNAPRRPESSSRPPRAGSRPSRRPSATRRRSSSAQKHDFIMIESKPGSNCPLHAPWVRSASVADMQRASKATPIMIERNGLPSTINGLEGSRKVAIKSA